MATVETASLGEVLSPNSNRALAKPSKIRICEICDVRLADGLLGRMCLVCQRKMQFEKLPPDEQRQALLALVPEKYVGAELDHLTEKLRTALTKETDVGVLLWGAAGIGKTYAMAALAKMHTREGYLACRIHYEMLCLQLRDTFNPKAVQTEWSIIEPLLNCDKLYIEDVGTTKSIGERESDFSLRTFLILLDIRMEHCRPTYITSNKSVENLTNGFDERVGDRLKTFSVFNLGTKSKRK